MQILAVENFIDGVALVDSVAAVDGVAVVDGITAMDVQLVVSQLAAGTILDNEW